MLFENREHAARLLARSLSAYIQEQEPIGFGDPPWRDRHAPDHRDALGGELDVSVGAQTGSTGSA